MYMNEEKGLNIICLNFRISYGFRLFKCKLFHYVCTHLAKYYRFLLFGTFHRHIAAQILKSKPGNETSVEYPNFNGLIKIRSKK